MYILQIINPDTGEVAARHEFESEPSQAVKDRILEMYEFPEEE